MLDIIILVMLLYSDVSEMDEWVVEFAGLARVLHIAKTRKTMSILVDTKRPVACYEDVETQVEFFPTDEHRVFDVPRDHLHGWTIFKSFIIAITQVAT